MLAERETWLAFKRWVLAEIAKLEAEIAHYRISGFNRAEIERIEPEIASYRELAQKKEQEIEAKKQANVSVPESDQKALISHEREADDEAAQTDVGNEVSFVQSGKGAGAGGGPSTSGGATPQTNSSGGGGGGSSAPSGSGAMSQVTLALQPSRISAILRQQACSKDQIVLHAETEENFSKESREFTHIEWRSIAEVIQYLGAIARYEDINGAVSWGVKKDRLFTYKTGDDGRLTVNYRGTDFSVPNLQPIDLRISPAVYPQRYSRSYEACLIAMNRALNWDRYKARDSYAALSDEQDITKALKANPWADVVWEREHPKGPVCTVWHLAPLPLFVAGWVPIAGSKTIPSLVDWVTETDPALVRAAVADMGARCFAAGPSDKMVKRSQSAASKYQSMLAKTASKRSAKGSPAGKASDARH